MTVAVDSYAAAWRPQDKRPRCEWAHEHVVPPGSARGSRFDVSATPWLREPIDFSSDNRVREQVLLMPTGAGKTTCFDAIIPHAIAEDPGGILFGLQSIPDGKEYLEERLLPILKGAAPVAAIMGAMNRHAIRKDSIMFPHMPLYLASGAHLTTLQRRSVRYVLCDEVWRWKHGYIQEARARHHDRWNSRVVLVSQGGTTHLQVDAGQVETELEIAWARTDRREWHYECPVCHHVQRYSWKCLRYDKGEASDGTLDETAISQSARLVCAKAMLEKPECDPRGFEDTILNRRLLANSGRYVVANPTHLARHHGWHCNALTLYYVSWGQLAVEHAQAMRARKTGDESQIRIFRQKRGAENYREEEQQQSTTLTLGDYTFADYLAGEPWEGEAVRIMTIDVQRDHYWAVIRAWKADGSSRRLWAGRINTKVGVIEAQERYKVRADNCFMDAQFDTDDVYNTCAELGWWALQGDQVDSYSFPAQAGRRKFFSPVRVVQGTSGKRARAFHWSNRQIKRILERFRGGYREPMEFDKDISLELQAHMFSEIEKDTINKQTKAVERRFVRIGSRQNHTWDCEAMGIVGALIRGVLSDAPEPKSTPAPGQTA